MHASKLGQRKSSNLGRSLANRLVRNSLAVLVINAGQAGEQRCAVARRSPGTVERTGASPLRPSLNGSDNSTFAPDQSARNRFRPRPQKGPPENQKGSGVMERGR